MGDDSGRDVPDSDEDDDQPRATRLRRGTVASTGKRVAVRGRADSSSDGEQEEEEEEDDDDDGPAAPRQPAAKPPPRRRTRAAAAVAAAPPPAAADVAALLPAGLDEEMLRAAWLRLPAKNRNPKDALMQGYRRQFPRWRLQLRQRFSLLFHGCGSKRALLNAFASEALPDGGVLSVRGHMAGVNARAVLAAVAGALAHRAPPRAGPDELLALIRGEPAARRLYVLIHNIDGPGLRAPEEQLWLGRLAQCPNVHLVASVDHVNAALLWEPRAAARFRWLWVEAPTYAAYEDETRDTPPLLTGCLQSSSKRGAATVLGTLVSAARAVFRVLAERQLGDPGGGGAGLALLYRMCRERFILNSEQALRSHLVEFRDHELVRGAPGPDGGELLFIPMEPAVLRQVLEEMDGAGQ
ncbi:MAG: origin recognition complex subunit 2-domain-containing protein [Monoraphidium minutum]|nr:MAG: origin recognition complex subunit 2-domain-containing protein [Monoraphidium minutum]